MRLHFAISLRVVVFDSWYVAEESVMVLERRRKAWVGIVKKNRNIETTLNSGMRQTSRSGLQSRISRLRI